MSPALKAGLGGALGGFVAVLLLTFVLPSDHAHGLESLWTDHLLMTLLVPTASFVGGWLGARGRTRP